MKVGDTVKLKPAMWQGIKPESYGLSFSGEYVVSTVYDDQEYPSLRIEGIAGTFDVEAFQLVKEKEVSKFKVGDKVICTHRVDGNWYMIGDELEISACKGKVFDDGRRYIAYNVTAHKDSGVWIEEADFELLEKQSIERPVLGERKKDKIRMELVDQGFPLALLELAKVMTWANANKGYKDHDWKNIPDAENAFKGAAARHRVKFDAQRSFGNEMLDCTDEESGIIHLAHECFNNLALLELALAGKVK